MKNTKLRTCYAQSDDMTFICREEYDADGNAISTEVVGFYYGEPEDELTKIYADNLRAEYLN